MGYWCKELTTEMMDKNNPIHIKNIDDKIKSLYEGAKGNPSYEDCISEILLELVESDKLYELDADGFYSYVHTSVRNRYINKDKKIKRERQLLLQSALDIVK